MKLTYTGPHDEVEIPSAGVVCKRGDSVEVPASIAGRAPSAKKDADGNEDPGEGLLAQADNWQAEKPAPVKKES